MKINYRDENTELTFTFTFFRSACAEAFARKRCVRRPFDLVDSYDAPTVQAVKENNQVVQPAFKLQEAIRRKVLGVNYWERKARQRLKRFSSFDEASRKPFLDDIHGGKERKYTGFPFPTPVRPPFYLYLKAIECERIVVPRPPILFYPLECDEWVLTYKHIPGTN